MVHATTDNFLEARLGATAMQACGTCQQATGTILFKKRGQLDGPEYTGPHLVVNHPDNRCEFCQFLGVWMASEGIESGTIKAGVAKIVKRDVSGVMSLLAYMPFTAKELEDKPTIRLINGTEVSIRHGLVLLGEVDDGGATLIEVIQPGV